MFMNLQNKHVVMERTQTSIGVQKDFKDRLQRAIALHKERTGGRLTQTEMLNMLLERLEYEMGTERPRRDSNPVTAVSEGFEPSYRNEAFSEAISSHEHALLA